jgi:hypothetical protein
LNDIRGVLYTEDFLANLAQTGPVDVRKTVKNLFFIRETMKINFSDKCQPFVCPASKRPPRWLRIDRK